MLRAETSLTLLERTLTKASRLRDQLRQQLSIGCLLRLGLLDGLRGKGALMWFVEVGSIGALRSLRLVVGDAKRYDINHARYFVSDLVRQGCRQVFAHEFKITKIHS